MSNWLIIVNGTTFNAIPRAPQASTKTLKSKTSYLESLNHYATSRVYPQILCFKQENDILVSRFRPSADIQKDLLFAARVNG